MDGSLWFVCAIAVALAVGFVVAGALWARLGILHGYDQAESLLAELTEQEYRKLKEQEATNTDTASLSEGKYERIKDANR